MHRPELQVELSLTARTRKTQRRKSKALRPATGAKRPTCKHGRQTASESHGCHRETTQRQHIDVTPSQEQHNMSTQHSNIPQHTNWASDSHPSKK